MANQLIDALGIPLSECHRWLPDRVALWPTPKKLVNKEAAYEWKSLHIPKPGRLVGCWWCDPYYKKTHFHDLEVHHISGGAQRHDAPWNFFLACPKCHRDSGDVAMRKNLYRVLTLKHRYDQEHTAWYPLAIGLGRRLPTAEGDET